MLSTLAGYYSGQYVSNFNRFNKLYRVMIQSSPEYRVAPESLDKIFTRTDSGEAAPGYSSGDAIRAIREVAASNLPRGYSFEFAGISREESQTTGNTAIIFLICTVRLPHPVRPVREFLRARVLHPLPISPGVGEARGVPARPRLGDTERDGSHSGTEERET